MKVILEATSVMVVLDSYGEKRTRDDGVPYVHTPLPICKIPIGYDRSDEEAIALAEQIRDALSSAKFPG